MTKITRLYAVFTAYFAITNIIPSLALKGGYEDLHIYNYKAEISVGVDEPAKYISKYSLKGLIKVQRDVNQVSVSQYIYLISLTDVKHDSCYGEDTIRTNKYEPVDEQLLGTSFTAIYKPDGQLKSIKMKESEAQWLREMKMSIARLLQFHWSSAQKDLNKEGKMHVAHVEEKTAHGTCFVHYNTTLIKNASKTNKKFNMVKIIHPTKCTEFNRLDHKKTKIHSIYELEILKNQPIITKLFNFERYYFDYESSSYLFSHQNPQFVKVRQTLFLKKTEPGDAFLHSSKNILKNKNNRNVKLNEEQVISKVKGLLLELNQYANEHQLNEIKPGTEHRQFFNKIHDYLSDLDINGFEKLYNEISRTKISEILRKSFAQIIPFVGTKSASFFIINLIMEHKVSDAQAIDFLEVLEHIQYSDELLPQMEILLQKNNGLSPTVQQAAADSLSYLLNKVCRNSRKSSNVSVEKYIRTIDALMKDASTADAKIAYLIALGNTQCRDVIKYIKPLIPRQKNDSKNQIRLRMIAISMIMRLINADDTEVLDELKKILYNKNETKELRMAAYKVLVHKSDFDTEDLIEIGRKLSTNEYLQSYHLTTMRNFNQIGILTDGALSKIDTKAATPPSSSPINIVEKIDDSIDRELFKILQVLNENLRKPEFIRLIVAGDIMDSSITLFELELFDIVEGTIIIDQSLYFHSEFSFSNFDNSVLENTFFDFLRLKNYRFTTYSLELSQKMIEKFDIKEYLKQVVFLKPGFSYRELKAFSIPTGFGIDAVCKDKKPVLRNFNYSYDWSLTKDYAEAQMNFSYDYWLHGYNDISFFNPLSQLTYVARKAIVQESAAAFNIIAKYDFTKQSIELIIPLLSKDPQSKIVKNLVNDRTSTFTSSNVMITHRYDEFSCPTCGYEYTTKPGTVKLTKRFDVPSSFKLYNKLYKTIKYDCDLPERFIFGVNNHRLRYLNATASTCGTLALLELDPSMSQIEFAVVFNEHKLVSSTSDPWYFIPGIEVNVDGYVGVRSLFDHGITMLSKLNIILTSSQGHFLNEGRLRLIIRQNDDTNFNLCLDSKVSFPKIADTHLPSKVTDLKSFVDVRLSLGEFKDELCTGAKNSYDIRFTNEIPQEYLDRLEEYSRKGKCAKQMKNSSYVYPSGSYLMTKNCIKELISKTSMRRSRVDFKSDMIAENSLLIIIDAIEIVKTKLKEIFSLRHHLDVDVKSLSEIKEIVLNKTISFQIDIRDIDTQMALSLPNFYFPSDFVQLFIQNNIMVINVYPKLVLFNNNEMKDLLATLKHWTLIAHNDREPSYEIYVKLLENDQLTLKLLHNGQQLRLEPSITNGDSRSNSVPRIFYNQYIDDFSERTFLKSGEDILFSLLKVDGYLVVHYRRKIETIIYYSTNSVTVLKKTLLD